jgi:uncharacterized membrane protein YfcA
MAINADKADLNLGLPLIITLAISVFLNALLARIFFNESLNIIDWFAILCISIGIVFITLGAAAHEGDIKNHPEKDPKATEGLKEEAMLML